VELLPSGEVEVGVRSDQRGNCTTSEPRQPSALSSSDATYPTPATALTRPPAQAQIHRRSRQDDLQRCVERVAAVVEQLAQRATGPRPASLLAVDRVQRLVHEQPNSEREPEPLRRALGSDSDLARGCGGRIKRRTVSLKYPARGVDASQDCRLCDALEPLERATADESTHRNPSWATS
jgi:hypothetical protein